TGNADLQQDLTVQGALPDRVIAVIGQPDRLVRRHMHAMRAVENVLAPGPQKIAVAVEHDHRMLTAVEAVHMILPIHAHAGDVAKTPAFRQFRPTLLRSIRVVAGADYQCHGSFPLVARPSAVSRARDFGSRLAGSPQPPPPPDST